MYVRSISSFFAIVVSIILNNRMLLLIVIIILSGYRVYNIIFFSGGINDEICCGSREKSDCNSQ